MPYIVTEPCIGVKDKSCMTVCPVDCIHPRKDSGHFEVVDQLYIDPDTCIDCGACVPECPVTAIFPEPDVKDEWKNYTEKNADYFHLSPEEFQKKWNTPGRPP